MNATNSTHDGATTAAPLRAAASRPKISPGLLRLFGKYSDFYLRGHFHSVRMLANAAPSSDNDFPVVIYLNHSSWWDPMICLLLARQLFKQRKTYGPIAAEALQRYRFFERLGFFGVRKGARGAADFVRQAEAILSSSDSALWLTPQGKFADDRARPLQFQSGLGHLARRSGPLSFLPLAVEYTFWEERLPEVLLSFGEPLVFDGTPRPSLLETTHLLESALASVQEQLCAASQRRRPDEWRVVLHGKAGTSCVYDFWRRIRARRRGEPFHAAHSDL
ncbi:MAG: 1-acyl-sn-glycerol-3-phosphate acyltransferase [Chthoniobacterales bacterium]|nr:1-acyl-sn-glycerol-3-phosphate acyltransferase [Chthoniobacterales bacterium]